MAKTNQPETLVTRIKALEKRIAELERGRTLTGATVSRGTLDVRDDDGNRILSAGEVVTGGYGLALYRHNGTVQFRAYDTPTGGGYAAIFDEQGSVLFSDDTVSGQGIARPYLGLPFVPWSQVLTPPELTTSGTFATLHRVHGRKQQPRIEVMVVVKLDAGTTGEIQMAQGASVIYGPTALTDGQYAYLRLTGAVTGGHMSDLQVDVQARRVGGAGNVRVLVTHAIGVQS